MDAPQNPHHHRAIAQLASARTLDAPFTADPRRWRMVQAAVFCLSAAIAGVYAWRAPSAEAAVGGVATDGVVTQRGTQKPLAHVTVVLDDGATTETDAHGRFHFGGLASGAHVLRLTKAGFVRVDADVVLRDGGNEVSLDLAPTVAAAGEAPVEAEVMVVKPK